ncbi:MAG: FKBP-type peptidyl-prolyl cis-trans isomerase [Pirellula sp.]
MGLKPTEQCVGRGAADLVVPEVNVDWRRPGQRERSGLQMKAPISLEITDDVVGTGRPVVPGDVAICDCRCTRPKGDILFSSEKDEPYPVRVGARDGYVGVEYGLLGMKIGGKRTVVVPPNLTYSERKTYRDLPENAMLIYHLSLVSFGEKWDPDMEHRLATGLDGTRE